MFERPSQLVMAFSQFLIMWSGDIPEEIPWYLHRSEGGWQYLAVGIAGLSFVGLGWRLRDSHRHLARAPTRA